MSADDRRMPDADEIRTLFQECSLRITDTLPNPDVDASRMLMLTSAEAQALLDATCYELDPGPIPAAVLAIRDEIQAGVYIPCPEVVMARIGRQRRLVFGRDFVEALAGLQDAAHLCWLKEYPCERWSQVSSLYWSCVLTSLAP